MLIKQISNYFLMTFVIQKTLKKHEKSMNSMILMKLFHIMQPFNLLKSLRNVLSL